MIALDENIENVLQDPAVLARNQRIAGFLVEMDAEFHFSDPWRFEIDELVWRETRMRHLDLFCGDLTITWDIPLSRWYDAGPVSKQEIDRIFYGLIKQQGYGHLQPQYGALLVKIQTLDETELFEAVKDTYVLIEALGEQAVMEATRQYYEGALDALATA